MHKFFVCNINDPDIGYIQLSPIRAAKIKQLKNKNAQMLSQAAEKAINLAVKSVCETKNFEYGYDSYGKPYLKNLPYYISISHSNELAVCAISDTEIGIDIQVIQDRGTELAKRFFSEDENEFILKSLNPVMDFYRIWTMKESYVKMTGQGISRGFGNMSVFKVKDCCFEVHEEFCGNYMLCICMRNLYKNS